jgi:hypothetical protein
VLAFASGNAVLLQVMSPAGLESLADEAWRLEAFVPPFSFSAFFSPEDTLLCVCAAESAAHRATESRVVPPAAGSGGYRVAELTSGSGLVGLYLLQRIPEASLLGLDIDEEAARVSERNALILGLADRSRFGRADLWSAVTVRLLEADKPDLIICNPPYVPEPPGTRMQIEAGAGPHGTAHIMRALELTRVAQPKSLALSWCSLAHPGAVVAAAQANGYELDTLYVTAIADGEYSGSVHWYLRDLPDCFISEQQDTLDIIAPDGSARFAYLLLAGAFSHRGDNEGDDDESSRSAVQKLCEGFARDGIATLASATAPFTLHCSVLDRWDELKLRVMLHGRAGSSETNNARPLTEIA